MSLKAFHVVFVAASVVLMAFLSAWSFQNWRETGYTTDLAGSIGAALAILVLAVYGRYFLRKLKNISYL
jgi:chromate transport protein ChrA